MYSLVCLQFLSFFRDYFSYTTLSQTIADEIKLIRMLARVDVVNPVTTGVTAESVVRFVNPMKNLGDHEFPSFPHRGRARRFEGLQALHQY